MNIEQIMLDVQKEFESSGLTDGLYGDFAREVAKRAIACNRTELIEKFEQLLINDNDESSAFDIGVNECIATIRSI